MSSASVLTSETGEDNLHGKGGGKVTTDTEIVVMQLPAKERQQPPELEEARMESSLEHLKELGPAETLDFSPADADFGPQSREGMSFCCFRPPTKLVGIFTVALGTNTGHSLQLVRDQAPST